MVAAEMARAGAEETAWKMAEMEAAALATASREEAKEAETEAPCLAGTEVEQDVVALDVNWGACED